MSGERTAPTPNQRLMGVRKRVFMCTAGTCGLAMCATRLMPVAKKLGSSAAPGMLRANSGANWPPTVETLTPTFYPRFSKWADEYFWLAHRGVARGVGGIFYDHLECFEPGKGPTFEANFAFTRDVGEAFLDIFPQLVRKRMETVFDDDDMDRLLTFRGRYVEFNLLYDRGTLFGLKTGGNIDAILMSLPPLAKWT
jgi:coproporphyrinogen III oxidase